MKRFTPLLLCALAAMCIVVAWWSQSPAVQKRAASAALFVIDVPRAPAVKSIPIPDPAPPAIEAAASLDPEGDPAERIAPAPPSAAVRVTFDERPLRRAATLRMLVTAYSPDARSCGEFADNITASGYSVWTNGMKLVAADTRLLPFGTVLSIPGYHQNLPVPVLDRGGAIKGHRLDVLFPTHEAALEWGARWLDVTVWQYAEN